jgi:hypothetical protein
MLNRKCTIRLVNKPAFSLVETVTVLVISALVLIAVINIYSRVKDASASVLTTLKKNELPNEILQRLAEDIDRLAVPGFETTINIEHRRDGAYQICRLTITNLIYDSKDKPQTFEQIIWQTHIDPLYDGMSLYRLHTGMNIERKVTAEIGDAPLEDGEVFIRLCTGITNFTIKVLNNDSLLDRWVTKPLPKAVIATVSFAPFQENEFGESEIPQSELLSRTIAIDRTRSIAFEFIAKDFSMYDYDPNGPDSYVDPNMIE